MFNQVVAMLEAVMAHKSAGDYLPTALLHIILLLAMGKEKQCFGLLVYHFGFEAIRTNLRSESHQAESGRCQCLKWPWYAKPVTLLL